MRIYLANNSKQKLGGGFSFLYYFSSIQESSSYEEADIFFISSATMLKRQDVDQAKMDGKKIVLRVDNLPKNSRNRNSGSTRLKDMADMADLIIYQSKWAKEYVGYLTKKDGPVIYNGVDTNYFKTDGSAWPREAKTVYLYSRFNRDESKRPDEAFYFYSEYWKKNQDTKLWVIGQFGESLDYNLDFSCGEPYQYLGVIQSPEQSAMIYRGADVLLYPYFNDACSNTLIEAMCCGLNIDTCISGKTGGSIELLELGPNYDWSAQRMVNEYLEEIKRL